MKTVSFALGELGYLQCSEHSRDGAWLVPEKGSQVGCGSQVQEYGLNRKSQPRPEASGWGASQAGDRTWSGARCVDICFSGTVTGQGHLTVISTLGIFCLN